MEDDLKILKVEYLCNHLLDHTQILNSSLYDHILKIIKMTTTSNGRPQNIKSEMSQQPRIGSYPNFKLKFI